jgi:hypothetical protein
VSTATLTGRAAPELGDGWRVVTIDCRHGTTTVHYRSSERSPVTDTDVAQVALTRHYATERCRCTAALRRRYGVPVRQEPGA